MAAQSKNGKAVSPGRPYADIYRALRKQWEGAAPSSIAAELEGPRYDRPELVRFCRRMGVGRKDWSLRKTVEQLRNVVAEMAQASGDSAEQVHAVLADFSSDESDQALCGRIPLCTECPVAQYCAYPGRKPTIKDMPETERPRERLLEAGEERLSNTELLAIILRSGSRQATALDLAGRLLSEFGSFRRLDECTAGELMRVHGIGPAKAAQVKAALAIARRYASERIPTGTRVTGSDQLFRHMREKFAGQKKEQFYTLMLDTKHHIIREERVAVGSLNESVVHPREVFKNAIGESAAKVIFVHNHPSGSPEPSPQDRHLTDRLCEAGRIVGIEVLDHLIVGQDSYFSFAEHGLLGKASKDAL